VTTGPSRARRRSRWRGPNASDSSTRNTTSTRVSVVLACARPGPERLTPVARGCAGPCDAATRCRHVTHIASADRSAEQANDLTLGLPASRFPNDKVTRRAGLRDERGAHAHVALVLIGWAVLSSAIWPAPIRRGGPAGAESVGTPLRARGESTGGFC
jgi:hypothetical protein